MMKEVVEYTLWAICYGFTGVAVWQFLQADYFTKKPADHDEWLRKTKFDAYATLLCAAFMIMAAALVGVAF